MKTLTQTPYQQPLLEMLQRPLPNKDAIGFWWLGQAGFAIKSGETVIMIDPYLSDWLAQKYGGTEFSHQRLMPSPILPEEVSRVDFVLGTHFHGDHIDPGTLPILAQRHPQCHFVTPKAVSDRVAELVPAAQSLSINAGERIALNETISVEAIPSAHEELTINERGEHEFLGYLLTIGDVTIYHSGDCTPYPELEQHLQNRKIDLALLPVNGRDAYRLSRNILGNFTLAEAVRICQNADIPLLLAHHFGLFDFNTINVPDAEREIAVLRGNRQYELVKAGVTYFLS